MPNNFLLEHLYENSFTGFRIQYDLTFGDNRIRATRGYFANRRTKSQFFNDVLILFLLLLFIKEKGKKKIKWQHKRRPYFLLDRNRSKEPVSPCSLGGRDTLNNATEILSLDSNEFFYLTRDRHANDMSSNIVLLIVMSVYYFLNNVQ